jgi:hypothetical protein
MKRWTFLMMVLLMGVAACDTDTTGPEGPLDGTYTATYFRITPPDESEVDVLAAGGSLTINITENLATSGNLIVPSSITGGVTASMAGSATVSGSVVTFEQAIDTFVRDLSWTRTNLGLVVTDQVIEGAEYTITLTKQ